MKLNYQEFEKTKAEQMDKERIGSITRAVENFEECRQRVMQSLSFAEQCGVIGSNSEISYRARVIINALLKVWDGPARDAVRLIKANRWDTTAGNK